MRFVDRQSELGRLGRLTEHGGFAVIWGRRRVGKTRLLVEWCRQTDGLYTVADQSAEPVQRRYLAEAVGQRFEGFADVEYPDWRTFFEALGRRALAVSWRGPLVIDELPYLVAACPSLPSALQRFIDHGARALGLTIAVAGSAQHMMHGLALDASSPLFGRASEAMLLPPLGAGYLMDALGLTDPRDAIRAHSVWGGVPRYWELAEPFGRDLVSAVDALVLDPLGPLHLEPDRILASEIPNAASLRPLLDAIGGGSHRVSEIGGRVGQPATSLSRSLGRLVELGLVLREQPFGASERSSKRTLYKMADPFLRLWFRVVASRRALLATASPQGRRRVFTGLAQGLLAQEFEALCRAAVPRLGTLPRLATLEGFGPASRFWEPRGAEWDVVSADQDRHRLLLGEVKWRDKDADARFVGGALAALEKKGIPRDLDLAGKEIVRVLFVPRLTSGARPRGGQRRGAAVVVEARDILAALR